MRFKQRVAVVLAVVFLLGRPAAVDAGWAGMLVQVAAMLSQVRSYVQTAEAYVNQAQAEVRGLLDPGGLVSGIRSLADWRGLFAELTDIGPLWEPFTETRAIVNDAALNYRQAAGFGGYDFGSVGGFLAFLDSQPIGWTAGKQSVWQALVDDLGMPPEVMEHARRAERLRRRAVDLRYARTLDTTLAAAAVLGDQAVSEYGGRGLLAETQDVLDGARRVTGGASDPSPALSEAEAAGTAAQLASLSAHQTAGALALRAAQLSVEARDIRLDAHRAAADAQRTLDRLRHLAGAAVPPMTGQLGNDPMGALRSGAFMDAW